MTQDPSLRALAPSAFLPAMVFEIGNGAVAPIVALVALHLGASPSTAGLMLTLLGVGQVLGDLPSSRLVNRFGDRAAMVGAASAAVVGQVVCAFASSLALLGAALLVVGSCNATFYLARQAHVIEVAPVAIRARAMSTLGGSHRIGLFIGPFLGAAAISVAGLRAPFVLAAATSVCVAVLVLLIPDAPRPPVDPLAGRPVRVPAVIRSHRELFLTLGLAVVAVAAVRAGRQTVLPLWAEHIGLSATATSVVFGIANAVDMALFYPSGLVMDRRGRRTIAVPSMLVLALGTVVLPLTGGVVTFTLVAMLISFGNGIGAGIMMTLGADAAPPESRTTFLSMWRLLSDSGNALGPVVVSALAAVSTLAVGIVGIGSVGLLAAAALSRWAPRFSPYWRVTCAGA